MRRFFPFLRIRYKIAESLMYAQLAKRYNIDPSLVAPMPDLSALQKELDEIYQNSSEKDRRGLARTPEEFLRALPKAELHLHSTAMADVFSTAELAWTISQKTDQGLQKNAAYQGSIEPLIDDFLHPKPGNLADYLHKYDLLKNYLILDLESVKHTSYMGSKMAFENGVRLLEIRTSIKSGNLGDPRTKDVMSGAGYTPFEELCARIEGFQQAEKESGEKLRVYLIISFRRQDDANNSMALLKEVLKYREQIKDKYGRDYIVGVDIAGQETFYKAKKFSEVFRFAREQGLKVTAHAGEEAGRDGEPGAGEGSIWQALKSGAQRIGHGTSLYLPRPMLDASVQHDVDGMKKNAFILCLIFGAPFEMCLSSNVICGAEVTLGYKPNPDGRPIRQVKAMTDYHEYPAKMLFALGSLVHQGRSIILPIPSCDGIYTLNTDLAREYGLLSKTFGLGIKELMAVARYSIRHSFAPTKDKDFALKQWRQFARPYLSERPDALADDIVKKALHEYRKKLRLELGITSKIVGEIGLEVNDTKNYLSGYLYDRFHEENDEILV